MAPRGIGAFTVAGLMGALTVASGGLFSAFTVPIGVGALVTGRNIRRRRGIFYGWMAKRGLAPPPADEGKSPTASIAIAIAVSAVVLLLILLVVFGFVAFA